MKEKEKNNNVLLSAACSKCNKKKHIDYLKWGNEYLAEAEKLKARIAELKKELPMLTADNKMLVQRKIAILYTMYLECRATGRQLVARAPQATKIQPLPTIVKKKERDAV